MPALTINVLGPVEVRVDGRQVRIYRQEARALAVLVAARQQPVSRETLIAAIWQDEPGPAQDGLATIMSRLRAKLAPGGLRIPSAKGTGSYRLAGAAAGGLASVLDAARFETARREGVALLADGRPGEAIERFRAAAAQWRGEPFAIAGRAWRLPRTCATFAAELDGMRRELVQLVAQTALRLGWYEAAGFVLREPVGAGQQDTDVLWLLDVLIRLRDQGTAAAERLIESRQHGGGYAQVIDRAFDLLALAKAGVDVHRPLSGMPDRRARTSPPLLVGRQAELAVLADLPARLTAGRPATLMVRGPAGVGKTRLAEELASQLASRSVAMAAVSCQSHGELHPWRALAGTLWAGALRDVTSSADQLAKAEQAALADFITGSPDRPAAGQVRQRDLSQIAAALRELLRMAATGGGGAGSLIVIFDDADLLTARGYELLSEVRTGLAGVPIGWLLLSRSDGPWSDLPELARGEAMPALQLAALGVEEVREWLARAWSREPTDTDCARAWERTGGLPARLCQLGPAPVAPPDPAASDEPAPEAGPGDLPQRWLAAAAITAADLDIDTALVAQMLGLSQEQADHLQAAAVRAGTVEMTTGVRFGHQALRDALAGGLDDDPALFRWLHRRAFEELSARLRTSPWPDPELPGRIAGHARDADRDVTEQEYAQACLAAARSEQIAGNAQAAIGWAKTGVRRHCDPPVRFGLLLALGDAQHDSGDMSAAGNQYLAAYELAQGRPRWQAQAAIHLARRWSDPGQADDDLLQLLRTCLAALAADETATAERLQLMAHLAHKSSMAVPAGAGDPAGPDLARQVLAELTPDLTPLATCEILNECRWGLFDFVPPAQALAVAERFLAASLQARSPFFRSEALIALAIDQLRVGPVSRAEDTIAKHRRYIAQHHRSLGSWLQGTLDTLLDLWHGRFDAAEQRIFGETLQAVTQAQTAHALPADTLQQTWQAQAYWLLRERGRIGEVAESALAEGIEDHGYFPIWRAALILTCCDTGRFDEAADRLASLLADTADLATLPSHGWAVPMLALLAEACAAACAAGRADAAPPALIARLGELLAGHSAEIVLAGWPTVLIGPVARYTGLLALAAGDYETAIADFDRALPVVGDARPQVTRLKLDKARALLAVGGNAARVSAAGLASQVQAEAQHLGMAQLASDAGALHELAGI